MAETDGFIAIDRLSLLYGQRVQLLCGCIGRVNRTVTAYKRRFWLLDVVTKCSGSMCAIDHWTVEEHRVWSGVLAKRPDDFCSILERSFQ